MNEFDLILFPQSYDADMPAIGHNSGVIHREIGDIPGIITPPPDHTWYRESRADYYIQAMKDYIAGRIKYREMFDKCTVDRKL